MIQTCPKCNKNECMTEKENDITIYLCTACGYRSQSDYVVKNLQFQPTIVRIDAETKQMIWKDTKTGMYWFPISFEIPKIGILYPIGVLENIEWVYMPMVELTDEQKRKYPGKKEIPDERGKKIFTQSNLKEALKLLKII